MKLFTFLLAAAVAACSPMITSHGIPNLAEVDASIYRSGQIATAAGWDYIVELAHGRKVHVVKLNFEIEGIDDGARARGFEVVYLPLQPEGDRDWYDDAADAFREPDETSVVKAETVLATCFAHPDTDFCLVHCTHGQDRTGYVVGRHRVEHEQWGKHRAYREMIAHDFHWELIGLTVAWVRFSARRP